MNLKKFFSELERRKVYRVAIAYGITAWLFAQIAGLVFDSFEAQPWVMKMIIIILIIGFPIAMILSWIFEISPDGLVKTASLPKNAFEENKPATARLVVSILILISILTIVGWWSWKEFAIGDKETIRSLAVLPFDNFSDDENQEYIAAGLQDNLITTVSKIGSLRVISRPSTVRYKDSEKTSTEIATELNVDAIVEASVMKFEDIVQINIQLIRIFPEERNIWTQKFEGPANKIYSLFNDISQSLAKEIHLTLTTEEEKLLSNPMDVNPEAYKAYLNGRFHWDNLTAESLDKALSYYEQAIRIDSNFAPAYAGIAATWSGRKQMNLISPNEAMEPALVAIEKAFSIDSMDAEVLYNYAISVGWMTWDWEKTREAFRKSLALNPSHANAHAYFSNFLMAFGETEESMMHMNKALELDPYNPVIQGLYLINLSFLQRCEEVFALNDKKEFTHRLAKTSLKNCYFLEGKYDKAFDFEIAFWDKNKDVQNVLRKEYADGGYFKAIKKEAEILEEMSKHTYIPSFHIAIKYAQANQKVKTLEMLERALDEKDANLPYMKAIPTFDFIRDEPRFKDILDKLNLPESKI